MARIVPGRFNFDFLVSSSQLLLGGVKRALRPQTGTRIDVVGTTDPGNSPGVIDPTWECFIDNVSIGATNPFNFVENNWILCSAENLADASHVVTVNVKSLGRPFWFDYFQYVPSANVSTERELVMVQNMDPDIHFDSSWQPLGPNANMTVTKGGSVTFNFTGETSRPTPFHPPNHAISRCWPFVLRYNTARTPNSTIFGYLQHRWRPDDTCCAERPAAGFGDAV